MKVFDTTTWSVAKEHFEWAANNGKRGAVRFVFVMDGRTGLPERLVDASMSTSDNDVFANVVGTTRPGTVWVFDRGYSRLETMKGITQARGHFITRWNASYKWRRIKKRTLDPDEKLSEEWEIITDEIGVVGAADNPGQMVCRRITCQRRHTSIASHATSNPSTAPKSSQKPSTDDQTFTILTDIRQARPAKLVRMYIARWPIEVMFRHIKSSLGTVHFPVRSPKGIHNFLVLLCLSLIMIEVLGEPKTRPSSQGAFQSYQYPFREYWRRTQTLIENEAFELGKGVHTTSTSPPPGQPTTDQLVAYADMDLVKGICQGVRTM
jgi:hypothetical protein